MQNECENKISRAETALGQDLSPSLFVLVPAPPPRGQQVEEGMFRVEGVSGDVSGFAEAAGAVDVDGEQPMIFSAVLTTLSSSASVQPVHPPPCGGAGQQTLNAGAVEGHQPFGAQVLPS